VVKKRNSANSFGTGQAREGNRRRSDAATRRKSAIACTPATNIVLRVGTRRDAADRKSRFLPDD
jgi:hypothetical protein